MFKKSFRAAAALVVYTSIGFGIAACNRTENAPAGAQADPVATEEGGSAVPQASAVPGQPPPVAFATAVAENAEVGQAAAATAGVTRGPGTVETGKSIVLREVRTGIQPAADRVVFEFGNSGLPAWHVEYVDRPVRDCGSGEPIPVAGDAWLQIRFTGAQAHTDAGISTSGPRRRQLAQPIAKELVRTCDFEGEVTWVIGVVSPNPYTPLILSSPSRLVIDIAH